jgi:MoaA/NifB/PqqE/SkfB family radical SAM enzyme
MPTERWSGVIAADVPAVARRTASGLEVVDCGSGASCRVDGVVGDELERVLAGEGAASPRLCALAAAEPILGALLASEARVPLNRSTAVRLDGFDTLFLELTGRCNERCVHCYAESGPEVEDELLPEVSAGIIDDAAELGFARVQLTGGDPLLSKQLVPSVRRVRERGMQAEIYTNGLLLRPELLDELVPLAPSIAISFYSHDPALHDAVTRTPGSQRRTLQAIEGVLASGLSLRVAIIAMEANAPGVAATAALLRSLGVEDVGVSGTHAVGRGGRFDGELPDLPVAGHKGGGARPKRGTLCVTSRGEVVPCIFNRSDILGRVPPQRLRDVVSAPAAPPREGVLPLRRTELQCATCRTAAFALRAAGEV